MSEDLIGRADAFLRRYRRTDLDADGLPVLTEVVETPAPPAAADEYIAPRPPADESPAESPAESRAPGTPPVVGAPAAGPDLQALEARLIEQVVESIQPHLIDDFEQRLPALLEEHLALAARAFAAELRGELEAIVRDAVVRAVEREVARQRRTL